MGVVFLEEFVFFEECVCLEEFVVVFFELCVWFEDFVFFEEFGEFVFVFLGFGVVYGELDLVLEVFGCWLCVYKVVLVVCSDYFCVCVLWDVLWV